MRILLFLICLSEPAFAQYYFYNDKYYDADWIKEAGISLGGMNCVTDLGGHRGKGKFFIKDLNLVNTKVCAGAYLDVLFRQRVGFRLETFFGKVAACDSILRNDGSEARLRYQRNLHFSSSITEISALCEFHPIFFQIRKSDDEASLLSPYVLMGIGYFHFNPKTKIEGQWVALHPLHTEGEGFKEYPGRKDYHLNQINVPVGAGVKYEVSAIIILRVEIVHRFLQTDYLDDVSSSYINPQVFYNHFDAGKADLATRAAYRQTANNSPLIANPDGQIRGNPSRKDAYFSFAFKAGFVLNRKLR